MQESIVKFKIAWLAKGKKTFAFRRSAPMTRKARFTWAIVGLSILAIISLFTGEYDILGQEDGWSMFLITRVPRTLSLMLTGAAMAMSGLIMQLITQNRLAEPTTSGTMEWGGLGLLCTYLLFPQASLLMRMTGAIIFSFIGTMLFFLLLQKLKLKSSLMVPIIGMMLAAVVSAFSTFLGLVFQRTQNIESWFVGSFSSVELGRFEYLWLIVIACSIIFRYADRLTIAGLGKDVATSLGLNYQKLILVATSLIACIIGIVTAVIGNLPFLGLIVPNLVTMFMGDNARDNLPWVIVFGMSTITVADILSRVLVRPFEIPVSSILGVLGALVFIGIIIRTRKGNN